MRISDWSSDVCSSDLISGRAFPPRRRRAGGDVGTDAGGQAGRRRGNLHRAQHGGKSGGVRKPRPRDDPPLRRPADGARGVSGAEGRSEEHTSELQSLMRISYAVFCLKKKNTTYTHSKTASQHTPTD